jgi:hypothetical protein
MATDDDDCPILVDDSVVAVETLDLPSSSSLPGQPHELANDLTGLSPHGDLAPPIPVTIVTGALGLSVAKEGGGGKALDMLWFPCLAMCDLLSRLFRGMMSWSFILFVRIRQDYSSQLHSDATAPQENSRYLE